MNAIHIPRPLTVGEQANNRELLSDAEVTRHLDGVTLLSIHRRRAGLTQRALATRAGVSATCLNEVERGKKPGGVDALRKLAAAPGVPLDALAQ